jgi:hypothetical protein
VISTCWWINTDSDNAAPQQHELGGQKLFWAKGPNFGVEVIVSAQGVLNCLPLQLWFPEFSKTPYMTGRKEHII